MLAPPTLKGAALAVWRRLAPRLQAMKLLTPTDTETFARYCRNYARWLEVNDWLDKHAGEGETSVHYLTETGYERVRAAMMVSLRLEPVLERVEDRFGLNPAERQRIFAQRAAGAPGDPSDLFGGEARRDRQAPGAGDRSVVSSRHGDDSPVGLLN